MPNRRGDHPKLVEPLRLELDRIGLPYIIENVPGCPMLDPVKLCGTSFGLGVEYQGQSGPVGWYDLRRHRLFESNVAITKLRCRSHKNPTIGLYGHHASYKRKTNGEKKGQFSRTERVALARAALKIDWTDDWDQLKEAIPPDFTLYLGRQLRKLCGSDLSSVSAAS